MVADYSFFLLCLKNLQADVRSGSPCTFDVPPASNFWFFSYLFKIFEGTGQYKLSLHFSYSDSDMYFFSFRLHNTCRPRWVQAHLALCHISADSDMSFYYIFKNVCRDLWVQVQLALFTFQLILTCFSFPISPQNICRKMWVQVQLALNHVANDLTCCLFSISSQIPAEICECKFSLHLIM